MSAIHLHDETVKELSAMLKDKIIVRASILSGTIAKPDDLVWLHDTHGPVADMRMVCDAVARMAAPCDPGATDAAAAKELVESVCGVLEVFAEFAKNNPSLVRKP